MKCTSSLTKTTKYILTLFVVLLGLFITNKAKASHAAGGEVLYEHVSGNTYKIIFKFYRDCGGINAPGTATLCYNNSCTSLTQSIPMPKVSGPVVVGNGCPNFGNTCNNPSSTVPGYEEHVYEVQLTLNPTCNFWRFWVAVGARNSMDWMLNAQTKNLVIDATFDNTVSVPDNSPYFSVKPVPYCCVGVPFTYNNGAVDINGDSLVFESVDPLEGPCNSWSPQNVGYTGFPIGQTPDAVINPIPTNNTFVLNPQTGAMSFTPTTAGTGVITIKCSSYRNGQYIGFVKRDIQVVVVPNCTPGNIPQPPVDSSSLINASLDTLGQIIGCTGDSMQFCIKFGSTDTAAILVPYSNINAALPGGTINYSGALTDSIEACVAWQPTLADTGLHVLVFTIVDSTCNPPGILYPTGFTYPVMIHAGVKGFGDTTICVGETAQLSSTGGGPKNWSVLPGGSPISSLSCTQCSSPIANPTVPTYYVVEGCGYDTVLVDIADPPSLTITTDTTTCVNANLQLEVIASPPGQQYSYAWTPSTFLNSDTIYNPVVENPTSSQTYTVTVTPHGANGPLPACASTASVDVDVLLGFSLNAHDSILCDGENTVITGTGSTSALFNRTYNYLWTPPGDMNPTNTINTAITPQVPGGVYTITASYPGCPDSSITIPVYMDPVPVVDAGIDREMCLNDTIHLNSSVFPDTLAYTVTWTPGADMNDNTLRNPVYSGKTTQTLNVRYTSPLGCEDDDNVLVTINTVDFLQLDGDRSICPGDTASLSVIGGLSLTWYPDYYISNTGNVSSVQVYPPVSQTYTVVGVDTKGCYDTTSANVIVNAGTVVDAGEDVTIYPGESVTLYADGNGSIFSWFPPSGLSSTNVKNPTASPNATTRYYVNAETEFGCPSMDSVTVIVSNESLVDLPNAFTPGSGTSINDVLRIRKRGIVELKRWDIFNRWGERVFTTQDIEEGWNGRFNNEPQPMGTYVYVIEAVTNTGKRFSKQGNVTLIR